MSSKTTITIVLLVAGISISGAPVQAQTPQILWTRFYGGDESEHCWDIDQTDLGGFVIVGSTRSDGYGNYDVYKIRASYLGHIIWTRTFGEEHFDEGRSVIYTPGSDYIIAGTTGSSSGGWDVFLLRTYQNGYLRWYRTFGPGSYQQGRSVDICDDGGFIVAGVSGYSSSTGDGYVVRTDFNGNMIWQNTYGGDYEDGFWSVKALPYDKYILAGWTFSTPQNDEAAYIVKIDSDGDTIWTRTYGDVWNDAARDIVATQDGGFAFCGKYTAYGGDPDFYLVKIDSDGELVWERSYLEELDVSAYSLAQTSDGGYIVGGGNFSLHQDWVVRTDSEGEVVWTLEGPHAYATICRSVMQTDDGGYVIAGDRGDDIYLTRLSGDPTDIETEDEMAPDAIALLQNHPNPFNASTAISYEIALAGDVEVYIYDIAGRKMENLYEGFREAGEYSLTWDATEFPSGVYFARLKAGEYTKNVKMVLLK